MGKNIVNQSQNFQTNQSLNEGLKPNLEESIRIKTYKAHPKRKTWKQHQSENG